MSDWDFGVGDASRSIGDFVLRKGLALGLILVLVGLLVWASPFFADVVLPLVRSLPPWAQIIVIGVWIAVGATLVGTVLRILGSLLGE